MAFDVDEARRAGYSDDEIYGYLTSEQRELDRIDRYMQKVGKPMLPVEYAPQAVPLPRLPQPPLPEVNTSQIPDASIDWAGLLPEWMQTPARAVGGTLSELTRPIAYAQGYGPENVSLADLADIPESKWGVGLTLAGMIPPGKLLKAAKGLKPQTLAEAEAVLQPSQELGDILNLPVGRTSVPIDLGSSLDLPEGRITLGEMAGRDITGTDVLKEAKAKKKLSFTDYREQEPTAGADLFDYASAEPAMTGRPMPARYEPAKGPSPRMQRALENPEVRTGLAEYARTGSEMIPESWYQTSPLYKQFQTVWGEQAPEKFERFIQMVAATSPRSKIPDNIRQASFYYYLDQQGKRIPTKMKGTGYGSLAQKLHRQNVRNIQAGGLDPLRNPKPYSFTENLLGNEMPVTIDTHNMRLLGMLAKDPDFLANSAERTITNRAGKKITQKINPRALYEKGKITMDEALDNPTWWENAPRKNEYAAFERYQQELAQELGMTPAELQEKLWVGGGKKTGLGSPPETFMRTLGARVAYTAKRMKTTPEVVLEKFVKGEIPLLELAGGALLVGAALSEDNPETRHPPNARTASTQ